MPRKRTLRIELPDPLIAWIDQSVERGEFTDASDFITQAVRKARAVQTRSDLKAALLAGVRSPSKPLTRAVWRRITSEVEGRAEPRARTPRRKRSA